MGQEASKPSQDRPADDQDGARSDGMKVKGAAAEAGNDGATDGVAIRGAAANTVVPDVVSFKGAATKN
ncbi:hypothetical protein LTR36_005135 [Oleoguttula mirabilis]|uniref:Uncharacterized protein n=1 Tax=Oleoguttula mirabilis TaxID=1507867 RepID=A0AAV9JVS7_9PEZI|nr:hypothetical protein LTR36_005135 [Oleoguttula mirabilis]